MDKKITIFLVLLLLVLVTTVVNANTFGVNGLITLPTADILNPTELNLTYQRVGNSDFILSSYGLRAGLELGAAVFWADGLDDGAKLYPVIKVNLLKEDNSYRPELALGVFDRNLYLVASKSTNLYRVRAHLGLADEGMVRDVLFGGLTKVLNPVTVSTGDTLFTMPITTVAVEYNSGLNLGANFNFGTGVSADIGILDFDEFSFGINFKNKF